MKAIVYDRYGSPDVLELREIDRPVPKDDEVLIRVRAAGLNPYDWHFLRGHPYPMRLLTGLRKPKRPTILGSDMAGQVESVGKSVTRFQPGDEVYGSIPRTCAEYACASEDKLERIPSNLTLEKAAAVPTSAIAALIGIPRCGQGQAGAEGVDQRRVRRCGHVRRPDAKAYGAEATGVCSTRNVDLVRSIGADHVIDYTSEDFTKGDTRYDLILDNVANHPLSVCRRALTPTGKHIPNSGHSGMPYILNALVASMFVRKQGSTYLATPKPGDLIELTELIETGKVTPVIDHVYPLTAFSDAMRHLNESHAGGKVVVTLGK